MCMCRQVMTRWSLLRSWGTALTVLLTFVLPILVSAQPPNKAKAEPEAPALDPALGQFVEIKAEQLAALTLTAPATPRIGPWAALSAVYAGASLDSPVWDLRGVFSTRPGRIHVGASSLVLTGFGPSDMVPYTELAILLAGERRDCWTLVNTDELRPFPKFFLTPGLIRDRHPISLGVPEHEAFWQTLVLAHYTSAKAFAKAARRDVTYAHLFNEPEQYRGQVVHVSGRMIRLRSFEAPAEARAADVGTFYEGWIMTDAYGENPVCVAFTSLPPGLQVDNERKYNEEVSFDGYFFKRWRYKAADSKKPNEFRDAPLLIGHTLNGRFGHAGVSAGQESDNWGHSLIWVFLSVVGGAVIGVIGLTLWFRYHDGRVRHRLRASRNVDFVPPAEQPPVTESEQPGNGDGEIGERPLRMPFYE
jgi:hypothetical protein